VLVAQAELRQGLGDERRRIEIWSILDHFSWLQLHRNAGVVDQKPLANAAGAQRELFETCKSLFRSLWS